MRAPRSRWSLRRTATEPADVALHGTNHVRDPGPLLEPLDALRHRNHVLSFFDDPVNIPWSVNDTCTPCMPCTARASHAAWDVPPLRLDAIGCGMRL